MGLSKLYLMCGVPGAGKSTWVEQHKGEGVVISRDKIRFSMLHETDEYFSKEPFVYQEFIKQITEALDTNGLVFADATHLNGSSRIKLLRSLGTALTNVEVNAIVKIVPVTTAIEQNENRKGTMAYVPPAEIQKMANRFSLPIHAEGFTHIYIINPDGTLTEVAS